MKFAILITLIGLFLFFIGLGLGIHLSEKIDNDSIEFDEILNRDIDLYRRMIDDLRNRMNIVKNENVNLKLQIYDLIRDKRSDEKCK